MKKWQLFFATAAMTAVIVAPSMDVEASTTTYTVQKGDTLFKIATKHETTVNILKELNNLHSTTIYTTQKLKVPAVAQLEKEEQAEVIETTYTVVKGDTLSKISKKTKKSIQSIKQWNSLKSDSIYVEQVLYLTADAPVTTPTPQKEQTNKLTKAEQRIVDQLAKEKANTKKLSTTATQRYKKVIEEARALIGTPYVFGGASPTGIDCSGLIYYAMNKAGYKVGRTNASNYFFNSSTKVTNPVPGDLVFFKNTYVDGISHLGIYIGNNQFIHAGSKGVEITSLKVSYWDSRFVAFKRLNVVK